MGRRKPLRDLAFERRKLLEQPVKIMLGPGPEAIGVQEVRVRDDDRAALPHPAIGDEAVGTDPAASGQPARRDRKDIETAELAPRRPALVGRVEP